MADWREYNRYDKKNTTPSATGVLVWVWEAGFQGDPGVSLGYFDGLSFRMWWGTDDCDITHWAPIDFPAGPS